MTFHDEMDLSNSLEQDRIARGRPLRILHIGNIANNAYNNAKLLIDAGLECDVICYDYYHLMGCPEWEESAFQERIEDQFRPDWTAVNLGEYRRPRWFVQGPHDLCVDYLLARRRGALRKADSLWRLLGVANRTLTASKQDSVWGRIRAKFLPHISRYVHAILYDPTVVELVARRLGRGIDRVRALSGFLYLLLTTACLVAVTLLRALHLPIRAFRRFARMWSMDASKYPAFDARAIALTESFAKIFPGRPDKLSVEDMGIYRNIVPRWRELLSHYDLVQAYATDPIIPMLADARPYVAFEHGTLRSHTLGDSPICRLTALAYNLADHTFITNGDCLAFGQKIGLDRFSSMLHPIDEERIRSEPGEYDALHARLEAKYLFLCTLRHDWDVKGTDKYIRAIPALVESIGPSFKVIMTTWGDQVADSRRLAESIGAADRIHWIPPLPKPRLARMQKSVDAVFDQIALPHFGATAPEAIAAEVPVLMSYDPASTAWIVGAPAPILSSWTPEDIVRNVRLAIDPAWRSEYAGLARLWIDRYHSKAEVLRRHLEAYFPLLGLDHDSTPQLAQSSEPVETRHDERFHRA